MFVNSLKIKYVCKKPCFCRAQSTESGKFHSYSCLVTILLVRYHQMGKTLFRKACKAKHHAIIEAQGKATVAQLNHSVSPCRIDCPINYK